MPGRAARGAPGRSATTRRSRRPDRRRGRGGDRAAGLRRVLRRDLAARDRRPPQRARASAPSGAAVAPVLDQPDARQPASIGATSRIKGETYEGQHEPIVSRDQWVEAEQLRQAAARTPGGGRGPRPKGRHLLTAGCCAAGCAASRWTRSRSRPGHRAAVRGLRVLGRRRRLPFDAGWTDRGELPTICPQPPIKRELIDGAVWSSSRRRARPGRDQGRCRPRPRAKRAELSALHDQAERRPRKPRRGSTGCGATTKTAGSTPTTGPTSATS